jgi:hypothetical protein
MKRFLAKTATQRAGGEQPSRMRAFAAATVTAFALGVVTYKLLRSGD